MSAAAERVARPAYADDARVARVELGLSSTHRRRAVGKCGEAFVGIDTAKARNAVAVAEAGRDGEVRYFGELDNTPEAIAKLVRTLSRRYEKLHLCYEAGPTGYGLCRQLRALGHECMVVAPSLVPTGRATG
jgi:transposase